MRVLRLFFRLTLLTVLLVAVAGAVSVYLAFDRRPAVDRVAEFTPDHIERATRILHSNDPRRMRAGTVRTVAITAEDADLALNYLAHRYADGSTETRFEQGRLHVRGSVPASMLPSQPYLNVDIDLVEGASLPEIERFRVGQLRLPAFLAQAGLKRALATVWSEADLAVLNDAIRQVEFDDREARLTYEWDRDVGDAVRTALVRPEDRDRLHVYQEALAAAASPLPRAPVSLTHLLTPVFAVAAERGERFDPVAENRAAILVLTFYVDGRSLADIVPEARNWTPPRRRVVTLTERRDFARHFIISAALAANTGGPFADAVGVYKEVVDSRGGSGFSFDDIAADRAGRRLGEQAEGQGSARQVQARLAASVTEDDLMPATSDLPAAMTEPELKARFGGVGAPAYARVIADIEMRISALPLYR